MYKLDLPVDYKEAAAIERRRQMEEERKSRIFNAKTRIIGVCPGMAISSVHVFLFISGLERYLNVNFIVCIHVSYKNLAVHIQTAYSSDWRVQNFFKKCTTKKNPLSK